MTDTSTPPSTDARVDAPDPAGRPDSIVGRLISRISRLELVIGVTIAAILAVLVAIEPDILEAPFENERTILFTVGGTVLAAAAFIAMLWFRVPPIVRVIVLVVPFVIVNWWLLSPYFVDDVVDEEFSTSISAQLADAPVDPAAPVTPEAATPEPAAPDTATEPPVDASGADASADVADAPTDDAAPADDAAPVPAEPAVEEAPPAPTGPVLIGAGQFVGLAGHDGTGDAGIFQNPDGSYVLRFENFDIENGPDLEVYLVPGAGQTDLAPGSIHLGALKGNIGDQNYDLPADVDLAAGEYTVLVWCEAFSVEFVGATLTV